jgi:hypothetical protein
MAYLTFPCAVLGAAFALLLPLASTQAQVPRFNDCRNYAGSRALTQNQRGAFMRDCMARIRAACAQQVRQRQLRGEVRRAAMRSCQGMPPRRR